MLIYTLLILISIAWFHAFEKNNKDRKLHVVSLHKQKLKLNRKSWFFWGAVGLAAILIIIRYDVGTDQIQYVNIRIPQILSTGSNTGIPIGYVCLIKILGAVFSDNYVLYGITTVIEVILFYMAFVELSAKPSLTIALFFFFGIFNTSLNISRQMLAASVAFYGVRFIRTNKIYFFVCIIIATSIHTTAIIYLPFIVLQKINFKRNFKPLIILGIIFVFQAPIIKVLETISRAIPLFGDYSSYFYGSFFAKSFSWSILFVTAAPIFIFLLFDEGFKKRNHLKKNKKYSVKNVDGETSLMFNIAWLSCVPGVLNLVIPNADRFVFMLLPASCVYAGQLYEVLSKKNKQVFTAIMVIIGMVFFSYYFLYLNCGETLPYKTWLF